MSKQVVDVRRSDKFKAYDGDVVQLRGGDARRFGFQWVSDWFDLDESGEPIDVDHATALRFIQGCGLEFRIEEEPPKAEPYRLVPVPTHGVMAANSGYLVVAGTPEQCMAWVRKYSELNDEIVALDWPTFLAQRKGQA